MLDDLAHDDRVEAGVGQIERHAVGEAELQPLAYLFGLVLALARRVLDPVGLDVHAENAHAAPRAKNRDYALRAPDIEDISGGLLYKPVDTITSDLLRAFSPDLAFVDLGDAIGVSH